ncbi:MAG: cation:proton antiporter [Chromatiales bacterium]|nr:cation:proton antiporter [Chromatiales bacterium]
MHEPAWLGNMLIYLAAAVLCVPLAVRLGLGAVLGYLVAGVAIGPAGLGLVSDVEAILHFAEFGVVLMLFLIGLELEPRRLWAMRRDVFGGGVIQLLACGGLLAGAGLALGLAGGTALLLGLTLALSSTAIAVRILNERNLLPTPVGQLTFGILLFQDIAAIPLIALPSLFGHGGGTDGNHVSVGFEAGGHRWHPGDRIVRRRPDLAPDRPHRHPGTVHRRRAADCGRHRGADATRWSVDGAGRFSRRGGAGEVRVSPCPGSRSGTIQGPAARPVFHRHRHVDRPAAAIRAAGHGAGACRRLPVVEAAGAVADAPDRWARRPRTAGCWRRCWRLAVSSPSSFSA